MNSVNKSILVGVFIRSAVIKKLNRQRSTVSINSLRKAGEIVGNQVYFFSEKDVNINNKSILGTYYNSYSKVWERMVFPFPDILYNRRAEGKNNNAVQSFRKAIKSFNIKCLNPINDFDKWELYQSLKNYPKISTYLPETIIYKEDDDIQKMLDKHGSIYIKAVTGRSGRFVMRLKKLGVHHFEYSYVSDKIVSETASCLNEVNAPIQELFDRKALIIQQAIDVININDCNVDMRGELQRNGKGEVQIVGNIVRIGLPKSPITSTRSNSIIYKFDSFFKNKIKLSNEHFQQISKEVDAFLLQVYMSVEEIYGSFGDLGIDFAIDKNFKLWLIECNSKSAKAAFFSAYNQLECEKAFINIMEYARFISENLSLV